MKAHCVKKPERRTAVFKISKKKSGEIETVIVTVEIIILTDIISVIRWIVESAVIIYIACFVRYVKFRSPQDGGRRMLAPPKPARGARCVIGLWELRWHAVNRRLEPRPILPAANGGVPFRKMEFRSRRQNAMGVDISAIPYRYSGGST